MHLYEVFSIGHWILFFVCSVLLLVVVHDSDCIYGGVRENLLGVHNMSNINGLKSADEIQPKGFLLVLTEVDNSCALPVEN
jgi:hypothetical protein